jgi:outer membrane protein OmpA-like peptidoglycan-associated protein
MKNEKNNLKKLVKMKKVLTILFTALPFFLFAQNDCNFFEHTTIQIEKTNINTSASDFGPSIVSNELWFSAFTEAEISKISQGVTKDIFYNLYSSSLNNDGNVGESKNIEIEEISSGYHSGPVSYCANTKELFVTLSNYDNPDVKNKVYQVADIHLKIIVLKEVDGNWTISEELPFNNATYSVGHPAIAEGGKVLYFTSDIPGGKGGTDIYKSVPTNGVWGDPVNLGDKINTTGNEMFPFMYKNNMLIFASNGMDDSNDLDLFYSCVSGNSFTEPIALNELNSDSDDFGLVIHNNEKVGYFASKRADGLGDDDIYKVTFEKGEFKLELLVRDKNSLEPIASAAVNFNDNVNLVTDRSGMVKRDLDYNSDYTATSDVDGYMNESVSFTTSNKEYGVIKQTINVEKVVVGQKFVMENIFYDFDKWDILPESEVELNKLVKIMKDNPDWKVELGSHTDCRGSDSYNEVLSQKRSDSAVSYIISNGISSDRIIAKGYGETQLVNKCDDGVNCSEEEHRANRRTEFKILELGE